jgi:hypothetical protein
VASRVAVASPVPAEVAEGPVVERVISTALHHRRLTVLPEALVGAWGQALMDSQETPVAMESMARYR